MAQAIQEEQFQLDPTIFNRALYSSILQFWVPGYPIPTSHCAREDLQRWFSRSDAVDEEARRLTKAALDSISPEHLKLPPFKSHEDDRQLYRCIAAPFTDQLGRYQTKEDDETDHKQQQRARDETALALCILLDQMPRNIFRSNEGKALVFTHYDRIARAVSQAVRNYPVSCTKPLQDVQRIRDGVETAKNCMLDECLRFRDAFPWRMWFYFPLEHSESLVDHDVHEAKLAAMVQRAIDSGDEAGRAFCERALEIGKQHREPLERFGRYPWRNESLGRETTAEEQKYLDDNDGGFG